MRERTQQKRQELLNSKQNAVDAEQTYQAGKIGSIAAKFVEMGITRIRHSMEEELERPVSMDEAANWLDMNVDELTFSDIDDIIASDLKVRLVINSSMRIASAVLTHHNGWKEELLTKRESLLLDLAKLYRYDIYELFSERPRLLKFFTDYLLYTLRLQ